MKLKVILWSILCNCIFCIQLTDSKLSNIKNIHFATSIRQVLNTKQNLYQSAIIFADDINKFDEIDANLVLNNNFQKHIILIIVFMNANRRTFKKIRGRAYLKVNSSYMELYTYFFAVDKDEFLLVSLEWFSKKYCNNPHLALINSFNKLEQKWNYELKYQQKFMNFWNCMITLETDLKDILSVNLYNGLITGLVPEFFRILSSVGNFNSNFQIQLSTNEPYVRDGIIFYSNVYFSLGMYSTYTFGKVHFGSAFIQSSYPFYVTPGELYTSYEKLLLPFDDMTWYYIIITYFVVFLVLFILKFLPKWIQGTVYGSNVQTPALNVLQILFGISQIKVPNETSPRIILIGFLFFCLVIRTAYQGVSFDFLTSEMRKKPIDSIEKLISQNFTVVTMESSGYAFADLISTMVGKYQG